MKVNIFSHWAAEYVGLIHVAVTGTYRELTLKVNLKLTYQYLGLYYKL